MSEIKKCAENRFHEVQLVQPEHCDANGKLQLWVLLNWVEMAQSKHATCLLKVAPHYKKDLKSVDLQLYNNALAGDKIEIEARFYEIDKRQVELKIFARKIKPDRSSKRICRASYKFKAIHNTGVEAA